VVRTYSSLTALIRSSYSFFVNESLLARKGHRLRSATDPVLLSYLVLCLYRPGVPKVDELLRVMRSEPHV